ncbi:hypothetical protein [uncultured Sphingomonas sp.]|uniref:hypothetical protein n=1 Tax=uncultured Sphingomonas sp. TaxID=158754 RepID=UPI003747ED57
MGAVGYARRDDTTVDGNSAYVGRQNFDWRSLEHIDETGVKIDDAHAVGQLSAIFAQDWAAQATLANGGRAAPTNMPEVTVEESGPVTLVASPNAFNPPGVSDSQAELVKLLGEAKHDVCVTLMDYAPLDRQHLYYGVIDGALRAAAARGGRGQAADRRLGPDPGENAMARQPRGDDQCRDPRRHHSDCARGPIPLARVVHTKSMTIDGRIGWVGTSNWEGAYLDMSRNIELVFREAGMAQQIGDMQTALWNSAYAK